MKIDDDIELVKRSRAGDDQAFATLVKKYQRMVFNLIYHLTGSWKDTEDIAQKVFTKVYFSLGKFKLDRPFYPWLYRITANQCYDELRRIRRERTVAFSELRAEEAAELEQTVVEAARSSSLSSDERQKVKALVNRALDALPWQYRTALVLRDIEELSYEEIAKILRCSVQAARLRVFRGRIRMRQVIERLLKAKT